MKHGQLLLVIACLLMNAAASAASLTGRVISIMDGDTLTLQVERQHHIIRIAAIDAPERNQAWGSQSKTNLSRLAMNQTATAECSSFDRFDHQTCKVMVKAVDIGLRQISDGMAWWVRQDSPTQSGEEQSAYGSAELMAKMRRLGLWRETNPVPPWEFRREK